MNDCCHKSLSLELERIADMEREIIKRFWNGDGCDCKQKKDSDEKN